MPFSETERELYIEDVVQTGGRTFAHIGGDFVLIEDSPIKCDYLKMYCWEDAWVNLYKRKNAFHYFTEERPVIDRAKCVTFGASEMIMDALNEKIIEATVLVCDGSGTVITDRGEVAQGIGGRMSGLPFTTPRRKVIRKLEREHATVVYPKRAKIDVVGGCREALKRYGRVAVTVAGQDRDILKRVKEINRAKVITLVVHTTGVTEEDAEYFTKYGDLVWGCASRHVRLIGSQALLQLGVAIPVFAFTAAGVKLATSRVKNISTHVGRHLEAAKSKILKGQQHVIFFKKSPKTGRRHLTLEKAILPALTETGPRPLI